ncbi:hypothetical protein ANCDUO_23435 [Ancylostoma duodenale]|uniref:SCP domain-containing protein n=1 Tax=Ancylostoma duodenale TaxID=51022 RepID=A0A0C2FNR7_9BILA|nr:hypothetical protein ANCDUO_23435 [Ancylostoma duodenale]
MKTTHPHISSQIEELQSILQWLAKTMKYQCDQYGKEAFDKIKDCKKAIQAPSAGKVMNIKELGDLNLSNEEALEEAIKMWWGQLESEGLPEDLKYTDAMAADKKITDFVNMAFEGVTQIGCAVKSCPSIGKIRVACEYDK